MYAEERQGDILLRARRAGRVEVADLSTTYEVTTETIRRDLTALERQGLLRRVHGGAIPSQRLGFEPALATRAGVQTEEKERIAARALDEVPEEGAILLDAGSTTACLAQALPTDRALTAVTNSLPIAMTLASWPNVTLLVLGGRVRGRTMAMVDAWALSLLSELHVDVAFIATNGVSAQRGLTTPDTSEAAVKRAAVKAARRSVLLADHTKFSQDHLVRFADLDDIDTVITDDALQPEVVEEITAAGPRVVLV